jgi:cell division transport system ATP-binding protein
MSHIIFKHVSKLYNKQSRWSKSLGRLADVAPQMAILHDVDLDIPAGSLVWLSGVSGAGKTTLLKLMAGIESPSEGDIHFGEYIINTMKSSKKQRFQQLMRQHMGLIFQDKQLLETSTVLDNVMLPLKINSTPPKEALKRSRAALEKVGLGDKLRYTPEKLSGGEQQRLCIARAIVHRPSIILADEPTANLDITAALQLVETLLKFHQTGTTLIIATHDNQLIEQSAKLASWRHIHIESRHVVEQPLKPMIVGGHAL